MSGLLGGLLAAVGIVATVATAGALGIVAGALIAGSYAASQGWIGGSVGKFLNSGLGHGLVAAVSLGSAAYSMMGAVTSGATQAATGATATSQAVSAGAPDITANTAAMGAGTESQAAPTLGEMSDSAGIPQSYSTALASTSPDATTQGLTPQSIAAAQPPSATSAATTSAQATTADQAAVTPGAATGQTNPTTGQPNATGQPGMTPSQMAQTGPGGLQGPGGTASGSTPGTGMLSQIGSAINKNPGLAMVGGQMISGLAGGMSQQKQLQEMIAAQQWGNEQWTDPQQTAQLQSAAAAPITVPAGYLNRATAVRNLMNGGSSQPGPTQGVQPTPGVPTSPTAGAPAPSPTVAPVGMGGTTPGAPVPVLGMNATPRGGMI